jgi:phosphoglycerate dehydrogenase-like enzyme
LTISRPPHSRVFRRQEALIERLAAASIAAALDVFAEEALAADRPLTRLDTVPLSGSRWRVAS